ncbi:hypothetical protein D1B31_07705 [Neobacillus notoginsengisoli]|uniref:Uncharacterized protein n=1 Tax=Neobacillus notoginsengisoli TaxID=1578198 RepID=A0A417YW34_9BACI|nr:hypothetical protein [Neobacillus notoginsengisoli]RHW41592.1 hypothetical protein D1B31_07705 [Neobacillus notoginsengisoli]
MSDFMKNIIQEVLNKQGKSTTFIQTQTVGSPSVSKHHPRTGSQENTPTLNLNRPNYQRMKKEQRLSVPGKSPVTRLDTQAAKPAHPVNNLKHANQNELLSQLSTVSLGHGKVEKRVFASGANFQMHNKVNQDPKLLGKTKDGSYVWFFPTVSESLAQRFKRSTSGVAVGVITSKSCLPSQLLLVNDVIRENPDVKYHLTWDRGNKDSFVWEMYDHDPVRLEKKLQTILQILQRKSTKTIESYSIMSPSAWLSKQLNIGSSVEAISVLERVPYYASLLLLEQYFTSDEQPQLQYEIEEHYLILGGAHRVVSKTIQDFRRKTENLL